MTCTGRLPKFQKQLDGSALQGSNCTAASAAMVTDDDTCGGTVPTPSQVRYWTGDPRGGLNLSEVDDALNAHTPTRLDVRYRYPWADFIKRVSAGEAAILQGGYAPIADSRFDAGGGFRGNHAILVNPGLIAMDPLADGRRAGIYKYNGEAYPQSLLRRFAAMLNLEPRAGQKAILLGDGLCYVGFGRDQDANYEATVRPLAGQTIREYTRYLVSNGVITGHERRRTNGFQAACTPPTLVLTQSGNKVSLVRITEGGYSGFWISSKWSAPA